MMTVIVGYHCSLRSDRRTGMDSLLAFISFIQEAEEFCLVTCKLPCTIVFFWNFVLFVTYLSHYCGLIKWKIIHLMAIGEKGGLT